jgi:hypothetical protein
MQTTRFWGLAALPLLRRRLILSALLLKRHTHQGQG